MAEILNPPGPVFFSLSSAIVLHIITTMTASEREAGTERSSGASQLILPTAWQLLSMLVEDEGQDKLWGYVGGCASDGWKPPSSPGPHCCRENQEFLWMVHLTQEAALLQGGRGWSFPGMVMKSHHGFGVGHTGDLIELCRSLPTFVIGASSFALVKSFILLYKKQIRIVMAPDLQGS